MPYLGVGYDVWHTPKKVIKGMYGSQARRRTNYAQRGIAARRIQTSYRRYRSSAGNSDQRQLTSVLRSHRKANPYQITPSSGRSVSFWRKTQVNYILQQTTGFDAAGNNIAFGFSLGRIVIFVNGVFNNAPAVSNAAEFQALFDYYKINAVKMQMFFTRNTSEVASTSSTALPIMVIANDFDDIAEPMTLNTMNERVGVRYAQFDANNQRGITHYIKPKPSTVVVQTNPDTGVTSSASAGVVMGSQWIDTSVSNIVHYGIKVLHNNQNLTTAASLGTVTFVFDVEYVFKGYR